MIKTMSMLDPVTGMEIKKDEDLYKTRKVIHSKDDMREVNNFLKKAGSVSKSSLKDSGNEGGCGSVSARSCDGGKYGFSKITGKPRTSSPDGFKCSAKCRPEVALGHNNRDPNWVKNRENVDPEGYHKTYLKCVSVKKNYDEIFGEYVEEYNRRQTRSDRKIKDYYKQILEDGRNGSMKKNASVDTHRKPVYEFIFQIGKRDKRLDTEKSIEILEKFSTEYMPEHYPNLKAVGIYLHADEFTIDPITKKRLDGSVHVHFDFIPVAHALTKEEQNEEKKWRKELEEKARKEAEAKGETFNKAKFDKQDWEMLRAQKFGKALQKGMLLQSSMSGAYAEMGFRTKGKLTAQIQLEEDVRVALLDFVESYGIKVDRDIDTDREAEVSIDEFKAREDNKRILAQVEKERKESEKLNALNEKKSAELSERESNVEHLEEQKADVEKREAEVQLREDKVAPYVERIDTLEEDEQSVRKRESEVNRKSAILDEKENSLDKRESDLDEKTDSLNKKKNQIEQDEADSLQKIDERQKKLDSDIADFETVKQSIEEDKKLNAENERINSENALINERNAEQNKARSDQLYENEYKFRMLKSVCTRSDKVMVDIDAIGQELRLDLFGTDVSWREAVDLGIEKFKRRCKQILYNFMDCIRGFETFLQGKTSNDFRNMADDMDRNGTSTFEEYEKKHMSGQLDWQVQNRIKQFSQKPVKKRERDEEIEW